MQRIAAALTIMALSILVTAALTVTVQAAPGDLIGAVDQVNREVVLLDQNAPKWGKDAGVKWMWSAPQDEGWNNLSDVKFRTNPDRAKVVLVAASGGNVASINYATRQVIWQATIPGRSNPHSIELLPNGAVAVADSQGAIWYFPRGTKSNPKRYPLPDAHAVLYNDGRLWALGGSQLRQYDIHPKSLKQHGDAIPGAYERGHDLAPMTNDARHRMWLSGDKVYFFDKYAPNSKPVPFGGVASRDHVKSFGTQDDGRIVQTWIPPKDCGNPCGTDRVFLFNYDGNGPVQKIRPNAGFYKARPVIWTYY
jgi:hypothetical protein